MAYSKAFLEEVKRRTSLTDLISRYVPLKRAGSNMVGCCPFHSEKTPSFTVFAATNSYYCFGCHAGGDCITFVMQTEGLEYPEAVEQLAKMAGVPLEEQPYEKRDVPGVKKERLYEINKEAARFFRSMLLSPAGEYARAYLAKRQFTEQTVRRFGIGYAPDSWDGLCKHLKDLKFTDTEMEIAFLGKTGKNGKMYDLFRNRLMFPIFDLNGEVVAFSGRRLNEADERKYVNTKDTPVFKKGRILFGMNFAKNNAEEGLILCEGAPDCIAMQQAGFGNACATLGTAITGEHARLIARFAKKVFLAYDIDRAGRDATMRGIELLNQVGVDTKIINLGEGDSKDPDEYIKNHGAEAFRKKLTGSQGQVDYRIDEILSRYDRSNPDELIRCSNEMTKYIASLPNPLEREVYAKRAADKMGLSADSLRTEAERIHKRMEKQAEKQVVKDIVREQSGYDDNVNKDKIRFLSEANHEEAIIGILLLHPEFGKKAVPLLHPEDFVTEFNRKVWNLFAADFLEGVEPDLNAEGKLTPREIGTVAGYRAKKDQPGTAAEGELLGHIQALQKMRSRKEFDRALEDNPEQGLNDFLNSVRNKKNKKQDD